MEKSSSVVLNFKMNGQVQYAQTLKQLNMVMQTASKEYQNQISMMGKEGTATEKLVAEKKKLETQLAASSQKVEMLRADFEKMQGSTTATAADLQKLYNSLLDAETAHNKLEQAMERVSNELSDEAISSRDAKAELGALAAEMRALESEQKSLTSSFRLQNTELGRNASEAEKTELAQRQLAQQMELTDRVVDKLERQLDAAKRAYGENSKEVHELEAKLNNAKSTVKKFANELEQVDDAAEKTEKSFNGVAAAAGAIGGALTIGALTGFVSETEELATELARLNSNAKEWGFTQSVVQENFERLTAVTGDTGAAVETISNLMSTSFNDQQMTDALESITGAYIQFSDTLSAEGIADGLQETLAVGEAAGSFAELLERSGMSLDTFNDGLVAAKKKGTETDYVLQQLSKTGAKDFYESYKKSNEELMKSKEAQVEQQMAMKELGDVLRPLITQITEFTTSIVKWVVENDKLALGIGIATVAIGGIVAALAVISPIVTAFVGIMGAMSLSFAAVVAPVALAVAAIVGLGAIFVAVYKNSETFRDTVQSAFESIKNTIQLVCDYVSAYISEKVAFIKQFWDENGQQILQAAQNVFNGVMAVVEFVMPFIQTLIEGVIAGIKDVIDGGLNFIMGLVKTFASLFTGDFKGMWEGVKQMFSGAVEFIWGLLQLGFLGKIFKVFESFGAKVVDVVKNLLGKVKGFFGDILDSATSIFSKIKSAMLSPVESARDAISSVVTAIKGFFKFDWSLPKLKVPKFSIKPKGWSVGDLLKGSIPKLGVEWFAKGGIMTRPTMFGMNGNRAMVGGEAGPEAILPLNEKTLGEIGRSIAATMGNSNIPTQIVVQSILDGKVIAETITPFISEKQHDLATISAKLRGVEL